MVTPVWIMVGLVLATVGVTDGVLSADGWLTGQLSGARDTSEEGDVASYTVTDDSLNLQSEPVTFNDPYLDRQWAFLQLNDAQRLSPGVVEEGIKVAVLDTGVATGHEDLEGRVVAVVNFTDSPVADDVYGHGTHVAGIIAANQSNGTGIVGIAPASQIMSVKIADDRGITRASAVAEGIIWAVDNGASVINISAEFFDSYEAMREAVDYAWEHGALVIAAAGNQGSQTPVYPAFYENCIAVASSTYDGTLAPLSNYGDWVDVVAPGFKIYSTLPGDDYGYKSGTSFAAAHVSGIAALLFAVETDTNGNGWINDEVRVALEGGL